MRKILLRNLLIIYTILFLLSISCKKEEIPVLATTPISSITNISAKSGGNITEEGSSTVTTRGVCWSTGTTPTIAYNKTTDGAGAGGFSSNIIGLFGGTTYYVRAYATNSSGTGYGMAMSFNTTGQPPSAPTVTNQNATSIQISSAQLNGFVNANYFSTIITFEYGTTISYGTTIAATQSPLTGGTNTNVSASISGLTAGTIYHYRIIAVNSLGTTYGTDLTFTTLGKVPTVSAQTAISIQINSAQLRGLVCANYLSTSVTFEYGTTINYGGTITASPNLVTGELNTLVTASLSNLTPGTTYHYRVKAVNSLGTSYGDDLTFTTLGQPPSVVTQPASNISITGAILNGSVDDNLLSTTVSFEYGTTISYGNEITATQSPVTGNINVSASISGLTVGTTYHFRIKAVNSLGTSYGNDLTFLYVYYGTTYQGGLVFYIDNTGQHGLVCATTDQSTGAAWGCTGTNIVGADGVTVNSGKQNTIDIINGCITDGIAAKICYNLDLNGFNDWFLPSLAEMNLMYNFKVNGYGSFADNYYWSSTEYSANSARYVLFSNGSPGYNGKDSMYNVRAIRAF